MTWQEQFRPQSLCQVGATKTFGRPERQQEFTQIVGTTYHHDSAERVSVPTVPVDSCQIARVARVVDSSGIARLEVLAMVGFCRAADLAIVSVSSSAVSAWIWR